MLKLPGVDYQQITPVYENLEFADELYKDRFFRRNINVDFALKGDDFDLVWNLEKANDPCLTLPIKIQMFQSSTWVDKWEGFLSLKKGEYDLNNCRVSFTPSTTDEFQCVIDNEKETANLLDIPTKYDVDTIIGKIEYTSCNYDNGTDFNGYDTVINPCYPAGEGWTLIHVEVEAKIEIDTIDSVFIKVGAARQKLVSVSQPGPGWIEISVNLWVAPVPVKLNNRNLQISFQDLNQFDTLTIEKYTTTYTIVDIQLDNAVSFKDVLPFLFDCDQTIISDFFDINADGTAPDNLAYQYASDHLHDLFLFQASDVINADAVENATKFEVKRGEMLEDILNMFNCELLYVAATDDFRIEHVSYRKSIRGADLLDTKFNEIKNSFSYKYDTEEVPLSKAYKFKFDTNSDVFDNALIEYDSTCASETEETLKLKQIVTNIEELKDNDKYLEENFLFSAVMVIIQDGAVTSANGVLNYHLAFKPLIEALHVYNNPLQEGVINGNLQTFQSTKPIRLQEVTIKLNKEQFFDSFSPNKEYKTQLGWGSVKSAKYVPATQLLTIQLLH